jgi:glycosyltransferase involved in cell wall biosynthesis
LRISAIGAVYAKERPSYLREALESIVSQKKDLHEIILVIDGEINENLQCIIDEFINEIKTVVLKNNLGLANALNAGISKSTGDYILRFDSDDINLPDRVFKLKKYASDNPNIDIIGSWIKEFGLSNSTRHLPSSNSEIYKMMNLRCPVNHPSVMFKKQVWIKNDGYDINVFPEDYLFWLKARFNEMTFHNIQESLVLMRTNEDFYLRRRGLNYLFKEVKFLIKAKRSSLLKSKFLILQVLIKIPIRLLPNLIFIMINKKIKKL